MADRAEIADQLGPGSVAPTRPVVFRCAWPGKEQLLVGNFVVASGASEAEMRAEAERLITNFTRDHLPDGVAPPEILEIKPGALRWIPDDEEWRRTHG